MLQFRQAKTEIVTASKVAYRFLAGIGSNPPPEPLGNFNGESPRLQPTWFKNLITPGPKPSTSSELEIQDQEQRKDSAEAPLRLNPPGRDT